MFSKIKGIVPAVFTPMKSDGSLNVAQVKPLVDFLIKDHVAALYVCGSTGEGPLMTTAERKTTAEAFVNAADGRVPVVVQVGHNCLADARDLAGHAAEIGADAISAVPPAYFKIASFDVLFKCLQEITADAGQLPFYYYHIPYLTAVNIDMLDFLKMAGEGLPSLAGIKYSNFTIFEMQSCIEFENGRYDILFGSDEMLTSGLAGGAKGAVGSTFNFAAPLYKHIIEEFERGNMEEARRLQSLSVSMTRLLYGYGGQAAFKATMKLLGIDCGPNRLPHISLPDNKLRQMENELRKTGFFEWAR